MRTTPKALRLHIGLFGRRNVGKSSLLNALTRQETSIVSDVAGTTTDPVEKPMEFLPLGPVLFIDTAGLDDGGDLGGLRMARTRLVLERTDLALLVAQANEWGAFEEGLLGEFKARGIPTILVFNKVDLGQPDPELRRRLEGVPQVSTQSNGSERTGLTELRQALIQAAPESFINTTSILGDLITPGHPVVLVVPIDKEAPRGRLILPQVQTIRDLLDHDAWCVVVKEHELRHALSSLNVRPSLVVTDSQAFRKVASEVPADVPMTSFSILFSRYKGDLVEFARGASAIGRLHAESRVLIADACSHHPIEDDIARVKIPRWLAEYAGATLECVNTQGRDWPADLASFALVVHCGACMWNRRELLSRIERCREAGVPVTNFGMAIAWSLGVFPRALAPFPGMPAGVIGDWRSPESRG